MDISTPPAVSLLDYAQYGFMGTALLLEGERLGLFRALAQAPCGARELAQCLGLDEAALARGLRGLAVWGVVIDDNGRWCLSAAARERLDPASSGYSGALMSHFYRNTVPLARCLPQALASGEPQWRLISDEGSPFDYLLRGENAADFHEAMWHLSYAPSVSLVERGVVDGVSHLLDLGGGIGTFAIAAAYRHTQLRAEVFDRPEVSEHALRRIDEAGVRGRVSFTSGDFWQDSLPTCDACALGYVLSDYADEQCVALLRRVHAALPRGGRVIVLERLLDADGPGPFTGVMQDLAMMLETGGQHRTEAHYTSLLADAGFSSVQITRSDADKHAITGIK